MAGKERGFLKSTAGLIAAITALVGAIAGLIALFQPDQKPTQQQINTRNSYQAGHDLKVGRH
jgi:hypothetical protein